MKRRRQQENGGEQWPEIRRGWYFGGDELRQELPARASERPGRQHSGAERQESDEAKAERLVREELSGLDWKKSEFNRRSKGDASKERLSRRSGERPR